MLTRSKDRQIDKAKRTLQDIVRHAQQVAGDERLRADVGAALAHGSKATDQLRKDIQAGGGIYSRLAADKKLRKNLRAMLDDLDAASNRVRRKSHRLRNFVLMLAGVAAGAVALPKIRARLTERTEGFGTGTTESGPVT
jgi:hypothetical protein